MTRVKTPNICDFCGKPVESEQEYSVQINQKRTGKGKFVTCANKADMCQSCFLLVCTNGFAPDWKTLMKNEVSGKWEDYEEQEQLDV